MKTETLLILAGSAILIYMYLKKQNSTPVVEPAPPKVNTPSQKGI